jgi:hypothetical protein
MNNQTAENFMARQFSFWVHTESEIPLHEFFHMTMVEVDDWLAGRTSHKEMQALFLLRAHSA